MIEPSRRIRRLAVGPLLAAIALLFGPAMSAWSAVRSTPGGVWATITAAVLNQSAADEDVIGGVRVADVVAALNDDHVAVIGSATDEARLAQVVSDARARNLELSVVSLKARLTVSDAKLMAAEVQTKVGGTVLVLTPTSGGLYSSELSGTQQDAAKAAAVAAGDDAVAAARAFADSATAKGFPWLLVVVGVVVLGILAVVGAGIWRRKRRADTDQQALAELSTHLSDRLGKLAPQILGIAPRLEVAKRPDLDARFDRASGDYSQLQARMATPLVRRQEIDAATAQIADLEKRLAAIDRELDTLLPGLEPPSPAG